MTDFWNASLELLDNRYYSTGQAVHVNLWIISIRMKIHPLLISQLRMDRIAISISPISVLTRDKDQPVCASVDLCHAQMFYREIEPLWPSQCNWVVSSACTKVLSLYTLVKSGHRHRYRPLRWPAATMPHRHRGVGGPKVTVSKICLASLEQHASHAVMTNSHG